MNTLCYYIMMAKCWKLPLERFNKPLPFRHCHQLVGKNGHQIIHWPPLVGNLWSSKVRVGRQAWLVWLVRTDWRLYFYEAARRPSHPPYVGVWCGAPPLSQTKINPPWSGLKVKIWSIQLWRKWSLLPDGSCPRSEGDKLPVRWSELPLEIFPVRPDFL